MLAFRVTLKGPSGSRELSVEAEDEWLARQAALRRNATEGGPAMYVTHVNAGKPLDTAARG